MEHYGLRRVKLFNVRDLAAMSIVAIKLGFSMDDLIKDESWANPDTGYESFESDNLYIKLCNILSDFSSVNATIEECGYDGIRDCVRRWSVVFNPLKVLIKSRKPVSIKSPLVRRPMDVIRRLEEISIESTGKANSFKYGDFNYIYLYSEEDQHDVKISVWKTDDRDRKMHAILPGTQQMLGLTVWGEDDVRLILKDVLSARL